MQSDKPNMAYESLNTNADPIERGILATLLDNVNLINQVKEIIEPSDFFNACARTLFTWLCDEYRQGNQPDSVLSLSVFANNIRVEPYLMDVLQSLPSPNAIKRLSEELRALALRRESINQLQKSMLGIATGESVFETEISALGKHLQQTNQRLSANSKAASSYRSVGQKWKKGFKKRASGVTSYHPTGYEALDELILGLEPTDLIILGARPSMGKTTLAMNIAENLAIQQGKGVLVFSLEMPEEAIYQRSISSLGGVDYEGLRSGKLKVGDVEKIELAMDILDSAPIYIDDTPSLSLDQLVARAHKKCAEEKIDFILIDYLQLMQVAKHNLGNRNEGVGEISRGLKQLARDLGVPVMALSQLSRNLEARPNKRPINSDLRDSGSIEQDADVIMFVYRDEVYNEDSPYAGIAEIIIGKQRNGPLGTANVSFAKGQSRFSSLDSEQKSRLATIDKPGFASPKKGKGEFEAKGFKKPAKTGSHEASGGSFAVLALKPPEPSNTAIDDKNLAGVLDQLA